MLDRDIIPSRSLGFLFFDDFVNREFELLNLIGMSRVYVGNLDPRVTERELEDEFRVYGVIRR